MRREAVEKAAREKREARAEGDASNAATIYVDGAPAAGANMTITASYAIFVDDGICRDSTHLRYVDN
jgi:hypothetical protein